MDHKIIGTTYNNKKCLFCRVPLYYINLRYLNNNPPSRRCYSFDKFPIEKQMLYKLTGKLMK